MNKKILIIGIVILGVLISLLALNRKSPDKVVQNLQNPLKKEINVGNDICAQFPKEWVKSVFEKTIVKSVSNDAASTHECRYYTDENNFIILSLYGLNVEAQKKGQVDLGRTIITNPNIKMDHFLVTQKDGLIKGIYLIINPNLFITVDRNSTNKVSEDEMLNFAIKTAERISAGENVSKVSGSVTQQTTVPLPQGEDIARTFFNLIDEGKVAEAVDMLTPENTSDESAKQAWGVQFNSFEKITVKKIEVATEPAGENTYKITLDVKMKPGSENAQPMPYYGWGDGEFVRWITLEKVGNLWKVKGISTGP
jgi:hypothetical protein